LLCGGCEEHVLDLVYFFSGICVVYSAKSEFIMLSQLMLCLEYEVIVTFFSKPVNCKLLKLMIYC